MEWFVDMHVACSLSVTSEIDFDVIKSASLPRGSLGAGLGQALNESLFVLKSIIDSVIFACKPDDDRLWVTMPSHENLLGVHSPIAARPNCGPINGRLGNLDQHLPPTPKLHKHSLRSLRITQL